MGLRFSSASVAPGMSGVRTMIGMPSRLARPMELKIVWLSRPVNFLCSTVALTLISHMMRSILRSIGSSCAHGSDMFVSTAILMPSAWQASASAQTKSACREGSPPETVTPPPDSS